MKRGLTNDKSGQSTMDLPFGVIFSIMLIIVFIVVAWIAISHFLNVGDCTGVNQFYDRLQKKVDSVWQSQETENEKFETLLPSNVKRICFANLTDTITNQADFEELENYKYDEANLFLLPAGASCNVPYKNINHINITKITQTRNPYCIDASQEIILKRGFLDKFVSLE